MWKGEAVSVFLQIPKTRVNVTGIGESDLITGLGHPPNRVE